LDLGSHRVRSALRAFLVQHSRACHAPQQRDRRRLDGNVLYLIVGTKAHAMASAFAARI
jgi:hypothetical protein